MKEKTEEFLFDLGLTLSYAIDMFYRQIIINVGLPFEVKRIEAGRYSDVDTVFKSIYESL